MIIDHNHIPSALWQKLYASYRYFASQYSYGHALSQQNRYLTVKFLPRYTLDLLKIASPQGKSAPVDSGLTEGEVALATSTEGRPLSAEISWSGDGGALGKSSKVRTWL